jgi:predicted RNA methylase
MQGMLGIGAALLGACHVIGVDIDDGALEVAASNIDQFEDLAVRHPLRLAKAKFRVG